MWELFRQADQPKEAGSPFEVITSNKLSMQIWDAPSKQKSWKNQVSKQSQNSISLMASRDGNPWAETKVSQILRTALFRCFGGGSAVPNVLVHYTVMYSCRLLRLKGQWFGDARWGDTVNSGWKFTYVAKILAWDRGLVGSVPVTRLCLSNSCPCTNSLLSSLSGCKYSYTLTPSSPCSSTDRLHNTAHTWLQSQPVPKWEPASQRGVPLPFCSPAQTSGLAVSHGKYQSCRFLLVTDRAVKSTAPLLCYKSQGPSGE